MRAVCTFDSGEIMRKNQLILLTFTLIFVTASAISCGAAGIKYKTNGLYTDSAGGQHAWSINDAHTLIWNGEPYIPVGGAFTSKYVSNANEENYQADVSALETLKSRGITDIILKSAEPITATDPATWQRIIDYLDSNGFHYGIEMNDGPKDLLKGYLISPSAYRIDGPSDEKVVTCEWPGIDSAIYVIVNKQDNAVKSTGGALVRDGKVTIHLPDGLSASQNLIVYPHKAFSPDTSEGMMDIWGGFDEYRDRVLMFMKKLKFGPGLRFFLEPFNSKMDFTSEMTSFIPDSSGFRLGFEAYLTRKHTHEGSLNAAWGLNENLDSIELAARLIPLWSNGRGVAYAYDRASAHMYPVDPLVSRLWLDLMDYRDISAQQYMNTIAEAIKKIVCVPVVFKSSTYHRIYANPFGMSGFDGVGAVAYGSGDTPITSVAGPVYSLVEESGKTSWYIAAATRTTRDDTSLVGYPSQNAMAASLDYFREIGCKGFYVDSLQALPEDNQPDYSLLKDAQQIDWLRSFKDKVKGSAWAEFKPSVINYPVSPATGAVVKRLAPNTWWLPTLRTGRTTFIGDGLASYSLAAEDKSYLWSLNETRTITMKAGPSGYPEIEFPSGAEIKKLKGDMFALTLTETPTVLKGMNFNTIFPNETAELAINRLAEMIPQADAAGLGVTEAKNDLTRAKDVLKTGIAMTAYGIAQTSIVRLAAAMGSMDIWLEGETSPAASFNGSVPAVGASAGQVLMLNTTNDPPLMPYTASFYFETRANSSYEVWIAATPPADGSPLSYSIDEINWNPVTSIDNNIVSYAPGLAWYKIGVENLFPSGHALKLRVDGKRPGDNKYYFVIDAVVLSPKGFKPNGLNKTF